MSKASHFIFSCLFDADVLIWIRRVYSIRRATAELFPDSQMEIKFPNTVK